MQVSASKSDKDSEEEDDSGPPSKRSITNSNFKLTTAEQGDPFYILIARISPGKAFNTDLSV